MLMFGPIEFDLRLRHVRLLLWVFHTGEKLFQTGWFVESLATQTLVVFIIRTAHPLRDPPHPALVGELRSSPSPWLSRCPIRRWRTGLGSWRPAALIGALAMVAIAYLVLVFLVKRWFFKRYQLD